MARGGTREQVARPRGFALLNTRGSPLLASPPADPSWPLRAGAEREEGVTRRGARSPGRGAGESQPERAREMRARVGRGGRRAEGGEPSGAGRRGGGTARRPRPRLSGPALRRLRTCSLCLSPLDGGGAVAGAPPGGNAGDREPPRTGACSRRLLPLGGQRRRLERAPRPRRGHPPGARGGGADSLVLGRWGAALAPKGTAQPPAGTAARRKRRSATLSSWGG